MTDTFDDILGGISPLERAFIRKQGDIASQIQSILDKKKWNQRDLAKHLGTEESVVSRLLSGDHNPTLKTIVRVEQALGEEVVVTPKYYCQQGIVLTLRIDDAVEHLFASGSPVRLASTRTESETKLQVNVDSPEGAPVATYA